MTPSRRVFGRFSIRTLIIALSAVAIVLSVIVWRAETRRQIFDQLRNDGAIVRSTKSGWGPLFEIPVVAEFYVNIEGSQIRIGDQLYEIDEAEEFLLQQKAIASRNGLDNFAFFTMENVDSDPSPRIHSRILNFGVANFGNGGGFERSLYEDEWTANRASHR